jgi:hypothetical protein
MPFLNLDRESNNPKVKVNGAAQIVAIVAVAVLLFLVSCATPLKIENDAGSFAKVAGVRSPDIEFISYCSFGDALPEDSHVEFTEGILLVTRDSVYLLKGIGEKATLAKKIKFTDLTGSDLKHFGGGRQLQLLEEGRIIVIQIS